MKLKEPAPGSKEAAKKGCSCPISDNKRGEGFIIDGEQYFWMNEFCKIHGVNK